MRNKVQNMTATQRARILYVILVGNLDVTAIPDGEGSVWDHVDAPNHSLLSDLSPSTPSQSYADRTKTRLRTMLASQYSFGVTVGAPVVFFCGAFVYNLIYNYSNLGDNDTSHALGESTCLSLLEVAH